MAKIDAADEPHSCSPQSKELEVISNIIDENATICRYVLQDLNRGKVESQRSGPHGMSAEQVLRCAIVKVLFSPTQPWVV